MCSHTRLQLLRLGLTMLWDTRLESAWNVFAASITPA